MTVPALATAAPAAGTPPPGGPAHSSRTIEVAKLGLAALLLLGVGVLLALLLGVRGAELAAVADVLGTLGMCVAMVATGGAVGHAGRHWGAKEPSGRKP